MRHCGQSYGLSLRLHFLFRCHPAYREDRFAITDAPANPHVFEKGQLVRWKAGLKNRAIPAYNEPAIIREVLTAPVYDACETARCAGSPYFGEPLSLVLGIVDPDGDFVELRYDARRFEPLKPTSADECHLP